MMIKGISIKQYQLQRVAKYPAEFMTAWYPSKMPINIIKAGVKEEKCNKDLFSCI